MAWKKLITADLSGGASSTLNTSSFTGNTFLHTLLHIVDNSGSTINPEYGFNSDTGNNYARRNSNNGAADNTNTSHNGVYFRINQSASNSFVVGFMVNISTSEKLGIISHVENKTAGAGTAPDRSEVVIKWVNTSSQITTLNLYQDSGISSNLFGTPTQISVLGTD